MQAIQVVSGTVKFPAGKVFETKYGQRVNAVITLDDGSEAKLWGNPDDHELRELCRGQAVQLVKDAKGYKLVGTSPAPSTQPAATATQTKNTELNPEQKRAIAAYIQGQADLFNYALKTVRERVEVDPADTESVRAIATSIYIATQRKFNL